MPKPADPARIVDHIVTWFDKGLPMAISNISEQEPKKVSVKSGSEVQRNPGGTNIQRGYSI